ncbi:MAG: hypothetical protein H6581_01110 [Bacteroidia bacterium]|nr:hypothetical protein [Bacteroidia bacterium]
MKEVNENKQATVQDLNGEQPEGMRSMSPPAFQFAGDADGGGSNGGNSVQMKGGNNAPIQKQDATTHDGPGVSAVPADWSARVAAAATPADRFALIVEALGAGVTITDQTAASASDTYPVTGHLVALGANNAVNYDDNLNSKTSPPTAARGGRSLANNGGYTLHSGANHYIILARTALDGGNFYQTRLLLNHEFDHVRHAMAGSTLQGNNSEVETWTTTFCRDFHRSYDIGTRGANSYIHNYQTFSSLNMYYGLAGVTAEVQTDCRTRIAAYYNSTLRTHAANLKVFRWWIRRSMDGRNNQLANDLNRDLGLGITTAQALADYRQFPTADLAGVAYPTAMAVAPPPAPPASAPATRPATPPPATP